MQKRYQLYIAKETAYSGGNMPTITGPISKERRAHERYHVKEKVMLYNGTTFAEVLNISTGGVLCRFLIDTKNPLYPVHTIDLIDAPKKLFIQNISCIDLNWQDTEPCTLFGSTALRDCRLQFSALSADKHSELSDFIQQVITSPSSQSNSQAPANDIIA